MLLLFICILSTIYWSSDSFSLIVFKWQSDLLAILRFFMCLCITFNPYKRIKNPTMSSHKELKMYISWLRIVRQQCTTKNYDELLQSDFASGYYFFVATREWKCKESEWRLSCNNGLGTDIDHIGHCNGSLILLWRYDFADFVGIWKGRTFKTY